MRSIPTRILVVDDTEEQRYTVARLLRHAGFDVSEASSGKEALEGIESRPDLVVLDVQLPDINGLEISRLLKQNPKTQDIPILQISATFTLTTHKIQGLDAGADVYLASPIEPEELLAHVRTLLRLKEAQDTLRQSEQRFRALAENIPQLAWMTDADGWVLWYNKRWFDYTGTTLEQMQGWGWQAVHHPDHVSRVTEKFKQAIAKGEQWEDTFPLRGKEGQYRWFLSRAFPIRDSAGCVAHWFGTNTDITDRMEFEAELERQVTERTRALEETTRQLNDFCYSIAHDLTAPLRAQVAFAHALVEDFGDALGEAGRDYAERIAHAAERQGHLIGDLLAHISLGRIELPLDPVDLPGAVALARADLEVEARERKAMIDCDQVRGRVMANPASLHLVMMNLLSNALKFVPPHRKPRVKLWTQPGEPAMGAGDLPTETVRLWVEDNGTGIEAQYVAKLFEVFQRLHTREGYPGTGIGLAIVKRAVERMGGRVGVESEPGKGSRFWVELKKA